MIRLLSLALLSVAAAEQAFLFDANITHSDLNVKGFSSTFSAGGKAKCVEGFLSVSVSAVNTKILYDGPSDIYDLTALFVSFMQRNSNLLASITGGEAPISETFSILSKLCIPADDNLAKQVDTVHFLTHGGTLDHTYWDFAPEYSYVDAAAERGYATFSYDRLGIGKSDHPDPIQVVQAAIQVELGHVLVSYLKNGTFSGLSFKNVIGIGHSLGSALTQNIAAKYPSDFSAVVLTGHSAFMGGSFIGLGAAAYERAVDDPSGRFKDVGNGYMIFGSVVQSTLFGFYYHPHYDKAIIQKAFDTRQTLALGEIFTVANCFVPAVQFTGPVLMLNGRHDFFYCQGDCSEPDDLTAAALSPFFPAASVKSKTENLPDVGHNINFHLGASAAFNKMLDFVDDSKDL